MTVGGAAADAYERMVTPLALGDEIVVSSPAVGATTETKTDVLLLLPAPPIRAVEVMVEASPAERMMALVVVS